MFALRQKLTGWKIDIKQTIKTKNTNQTKKKKLGPRYCRKRRIICYNLFINNKIKNIWPNINHKPSKYMLNLLHALPTFAKEEDKVLNVIVEVSKWQY